MIVSLQRGVAGAAGGRRAALALAAGAVLALAQPPLGWVVAVFVALPVVAWLFAASPRPRAAFAMGWLAGLGYFGASLFWIVEPFLVDPERHGWLAPFALAAMAGGLALFWGAPFALARTLRHPGARLVALACLWTLSEYARSHVLTGFPWGLVAYAWVETPVMQSAALVGPHGLGFLTLLAGFALAAARPVPAALAALGVAAAWAYGAAQLARPLPTRAEPVTVRIVQPNAPQHLKWDPEMQAVFYRRQIEATAAAADPAPDVTIWPETAVPYVLGYSGDLLGEVAAAPRGDGLVILGLRRLEATADAERWYNSLVVLQPDGAPWATYDKHHLVPFGEYVPLGAAIARLGLPGLEPLTSTGFSAGPGPRLVSVPGLPPFLPLICYEAIFPHGMRAPEGRPEWLLQITNDAWFGTLAGPYQHLAQARVRAIEQGLPLARSANTGVSAMIDPRGRVVEGLALGSAGHIDAALPAALPPTPYSIVGDRPALAAVLAVLGLTYLNFFSGLFMAGRR